MTQGTTDKNSPAKAKKTNPLVYVGVGCLALIILLSLVSAVVGKFVAKKIVEKTVESKTGVKMDIDDVENGKLTFTDSKTGAKVNIGTNEVPDSFPKDFPIYPGSKVTSSLSGSETGTSNGFWLTLATSDDQSKVVDFYKAELRKNAWTVESTVTANDMTSFGVSKGTIKGSVSIGNNSSDNETQIAIILGEEK